MMTPEMDFGMAYYQGLEFGGLGTKWEGVRHPLRPTKWLASTNY